MWLRNAGKSVLLFIKSFESASISQHNPEIFLVQNSAETERVAETQKLHSFVL